MNNVEGCIWNVKRGVSRLDGEEDNQCCYSEEDEENAEYEA